jgi:cyclic-di-GMP phosphodiesterase TipF (flagellum assembly factor)
VQSLVYIFIAVAALGVGATGYFGLTFTPVESILAMCTFVAVAVVLVERTLRQRSEERLERAIEEMSRLLSTDAQAGATLSQRVNQIADERAGKRLEMVEADISVLGTVIRQVAEAVAEIEDGRAEPEPPPRRPAPVPSVEPEQDLKRTTIAPAPPPPPVVEPAPREPEAPIPLDVVARAIAENRLVFHIQPIVTLPQRRTFGYDLVPRLMLEDGELADGPDFLPRRGGEEVLREIDGAALVEAITLGRRARTSGQPVNLFVPMTRASFSDPETTDQLLAALEANRAILESIMFRIPARDWHEADADEQAVLRRILRKGVGFSLDHVRSLRHDMTELSDLGIRSLRVDAATLVNTPELLTDFHASDIAGYTARFGIDLIAVNITAERQILELLEGEVALAQGPHIAAPGPARQDLMSERPRSPAQLRRVQM